MSEISGPAVGRRRRRRAEAERSLVAILDAAVRVLNQRPDASMEEVAAAAGVSRQTIYAHYPSREALLAAAVDRVSGEAIAAMDAADPEGGPPADALLRLMSAGWQTFERYSLLLRPSIAGADAEAERQRNEPVRERLERLIERGQASGDFDARLSPGWLSAVVIGLGHAAGEEVSAERMTADEATAALRRSILRIICPSDRPGTEQEVS